MIGVLCGLSAEAKILEGVAGLQVYCDLTGAARLRTDLASGRHFSRLLSFGTCGGLSPEIAIGTLVIADSVISTEASSSADSTWIDDLPLAARGEWTGPVLSLGQVEADTPTQRAALFAKYSACVIDEESSIVAVLAATFKMPFNVIRAVSDDAHDTVPRAARIATNPDGSVDYPAIFKSCESDLLQLGPLMHMAVGFDKALQTLRTYVAAAAPLFAEG